MPHRHDDLVRLDIGDPVVFGNNVLVSERVRVAGPFLSGGGRWLAPRAEGRGLNGWGRGGPQKETKITKKRDLDAGQIDSFLGD